MSRHDNDDQGLKPAGSYAIPLDGSSPEAIKKAKDQLAAQERKNEEELRRTLRVEGSEKDDGKVGFLGFKMPKYLAPVANIVYDTFIVPLSDVGGNFLYNRGSKLSEQMGASRDRAHQIGLGIELTARWGIIFSKPIITFSSASKEYAMKRRELFKEFQPIIENSKVDYKQNEVVQTAFDNLHEKWVFELKRMIPGLITLGVQVPYALQKHLAAKDKRNSTFSKENELSKSIDDKIRKHAESIEERYKLVSKTEEILATKRKEYIKEMIRKPVAGMRMTEEQLGKQFDTNIAGSIRDAIKQEVASAQNAAKPAAEAKGLLNNYDQYLPVLVPMVSAAGEGVNVAIRESATELGRVNSWKMIKHLKEEIGTRYGANDNRRGKEPRRADEIHISMLPGSDKKDERRHRGDEVSLKQYVIETFQQLERDRGRSTLGAAMLEQLEPAAEKIADAIADGRLDAYALVALVGGNKVINHKAGGARIIASAAQVEKEIDALVPVLGTHESLSEEEFFANFANPRLIRETLKKNLATMQGAEKALMVNMFSDDKILLDSGMKQKEITELRKQGHAVLYDATAAAVIQIAHLEREQAKATFHLSDEQLEQVARMAQHIENGDWKALETAVDGHDKTIPAAVRTAGLNMQSKGSTPWSQWIKEGASLREQAKETAAAEAPEAKPVVPLIEEVREHGASQREEGNSSHAHRHKKRERFADMDAADSMVARHAKRHEPGFDHLSRS